MKIIGVTGGIGSGKTTIINYIKNQGYPVFIADDAGKIVMENPQVIEKVNHLFNKDVLLPNGLLDRKKIAAIVFSNSEYLQQLNEIIHPEVGKLFREFIEQNHSSALVFKESAILFESGAYLECDATIVITASIEDRIARVMKRDHISKDQVLSRINKQLADDEKIKLASYVVENSNLIDAYKQIDDILQKILNH